MGFEVLLFDKTKGEWKIKAGGDRPFDTETYTSVVSLTKSTKSLLGESHLTSYDISVATGTQSSTYNLCHLVGLNCMATMVREYLNENINLYQFIEMTGAVYFPSNMVLVVPASCIAYLSDWARFVIEQLKVITKIPRKGILVTQSALQISAAVGMANRLLEVMNNARHNLRYGDPSTNKSISRNLDPRTATGWTIEPVRVLEHIFSRYFLGRELASIETAYAFYTIEDYRALAPDFQKHTHDTIESRSAKQPKLIQQGSFASLSDQVVAQTTTAARNPLMGTPHKFYSPLRKNRCCGFTGALLLQLIGLIVIVGYLGPMFGISFFGGPNVAEL